MTKVLHPDWLRTLQLIKREKSLRKMDSCVLHYLDTYLEFLLLPLLEEGQVEKVEVEGEVGEEVGQVAQVGQVGQVA